MAIAARPSVAAFMPAFELVIEGEKPQPYLRQMEKSGAVRVLGPQIGANHHAGPGSGTMRMVVKVDAASVAAARELVEGYLPADQAFKVQPVIRGT